MVKSKQKSQKNRNYFSLLKKIPNFIADALFPVRCIGCEKIDKFICEKCLKKIPQKSSQICPICEKESTLNGNVCQLCKKVDSNYLDRLFVISDYKNHLLSKAVHLLKYNFIADLATPLGTLGAETITKFSNFPTPDIIIPVPLHKRRLRWRGFNQSELLAKQISKKLMPNFELLVSTDILLRKNYSKPQMKIKDSITRAQNIKNCFQIDRKKSKFLKQKNILLIDDICTTGSTLNECAKELKRFHPKSISAVVLARQS